jgi:hypothetical protein
MARCVCVCVCVCANVGLNIRGLAGLGCWSARCELLQATEVCRLFVSFKNRGNCVYHLPVIYIFICTFFSGWEWVPHLYVRERTGVEMYMNIHLHQSSGDMHTELKCESYLQLFVLVRAGNKLNHLRLLQERYIVNTKGRIIHIPVWLQWESRVLITWGWRNLFIECRYAAYVSVAFCRTLIQLSRCFCFQNVNDPQSNGRHDNGERSD